LSLQQEDLFTAHLRAILCAGLGHDLWVMFPMVSVLQEVQQARQLLIHAHTELERAGQLHAWPVKIGAMIEVPSAALISEQLAAELDFFSIGTNDLTQYVMAAERGNASLGEFQDPLHPAVLRLMKMVVEGSAKHQKHVSICGDAASEPACAIVFAGLGIHSLSVRPRQVAEIKALFRELSGADLKELAEHVVRCSDAAQVRQFVNDYLAGAQKQIRLEEGSASRGQKTTGNVVSDSKS
jgi:phosphoenolpyruvate-protein kinase (PTS system EI component)